MRIMRIFLCLSTWWLDSEIDSKKKDAGTQKERKKPTDPRDIVIALAVVGVIALIFMGVDVWGVELLFVAALFLIAAIMEVIIKVRRSEKKVEQPAPSAPIVPSEEGIRIRSGWAMLPLLGLTIWFLALFFIDWAGHCEATGPLALLCEHSEFIFVGLWVLMYFVGEVTKEKKSQLTRS